MAVEEILTTLLVGGVLGYIMWLVNGHVKDNTQRVTTLEKKHDLLVVVLAENDESFRETWDEYRNLVNPGIPSIGELKRRMFDFSRGTRT